MVSDILVLFFLRQALCMFFFGDTALCMLTVKRVVPSHILNLLLFLLGSDYGPSDPINPLWFAQKNNMTQRMYGPSSAEVFNLKPKKPYLTWSDPKIIHKKSGFTWSNPNVTQPCVRVGWGWKSYFIISFDPIQIRPNPTITRSRTDLFTVEETFHF